MSLEWTIGVGEVDVVLDHPTVSRCHASLAEKGGVLFLRDLDSTNGTRIERRGEVLRVSTDVRLRSSDQLHFGALALSLEDLLQRLPGQPYAQVPVQREPPAPTPKPAPRPAPQPRPAPPPSADRPSLRCLGCARVITAGVVCPHCGTGPAPA